jgi:hypothetical protein
MQMALKLEHDSAQASDGYVEEEIGECLLALGRLEEGRPHFAQAYRLLSRDPWLTEKEPERISRLLELSR